MDWNEFQLLSTFDCKFQQNFINFACLRKKFFSFTVQWHFVLMKLRKNVQSDCFIEFLAMQRLKLFRMPMKFFFGSNWKSATASYKLPIDRNDVANEFRRDSLKFFDSFLSFYWTHLIAFVSDWIQRFWAANRRFEQFRKFHLGWWKRIQAHTWLCRHCCYHILYKHIESFGDAWRGTLSSECSQSRLESFAIY